MVTTGRGYTVAPTLTLPPVPGGGSGATAYAMLGTIGQIKSVVLDNAGRVSTLSRRPLPLPAAALAPERAVRAFWSPTGEVISIGLVDPGDGFRAGAEVTFSGGGGTGAAAEITPGTCGRVARVTLDSSRRSVHGATNSAFRRRAGLGLARPNSRAGLTCSTRSSEDRRRNSQDGRVLLCGRRRGERATKARPFSIPRPTPTHSDRRHPPDHGDRRGRHALANITIARFFSTPGRS